jgi:hypothetical protein
MTPTMTERELGWLLADQLLSVLTDRERTVVFVDLGGGEEVAAIHRLLHLAARHRQPLTAKVLNAARQWIDSKRAWEHYGPVIAEIEIARRAPTLVPPAARSAG